MDDLKIQIVSTLNHKSSVNEINYAIGKIEKDSSLKKLNINIGVTDTQINNVVKQIASIQEKLNGLKPPKIAPDTVPIREVYTEIDKAVAKYKELGQVKINQNINPVTKELEGFQLQVTKANGEVEKLKFELASLKGIQGIEGYALTGRSITDNTGAIFERQLQQQQSINRTIEQRSQTLANQLQLYQRQAEIQVSSLKNNPNKIISSDQQTTLTNYLNNVRSLNIATPQLQQRMRQLALDYREVSSQAQTAGRMNMSFGESLQTAMEKFPINLYRWE